MNSELAQRVLSEVMGWDLEEAHRELKWLDQMSTVKYDTYRDFQAGMRFTESLTMWLQQFEPLERAVAYAFVKKRLVFIGVGEIQRLVEQFYPRFASERAAMIVAERAGVQRWQALCDPTLLAQMDTLRRRTLFLGLSDGARVDILRHVNSGRLSNEQVLPTTQPSKDKWKDLLKSLREADADPDARFEVVYLIDDFVGTGTSLLRRKDSGEWTGKLIRFFESVEEVKPELFVDKPELCVHHYIASADATDKVERALDGAADELVQRGWPRPSVSYGTTLPASLPLSRTRHEDAAFVALTDEYYDPALETKHTHVGGVDHLGLGYGGCALPLVLEHNTPNNSVALLWGDTQGTSSPDAHAMRPLFRRRQRHV